MTQIPKKRDIPDKTGEASYNSAIMKEVSGECLEGQLLIAMPAMEDTRFARSLVFICAHSSDGAMGLIINKEYPEISFFELADQLALLTKGNGASLPDKMIYFGGPVDPGRGFVLHSPDFNHEDNTQPVGDAISLTASIDIIKAIARHDGPEQSLMTLGYAGWDAGQLEDELLGNSWLHCPATAGLVFSGNTEEKYDMALKSIGISEDFLSSSAGHA